MSNKEKLISVIVPCYNVEKYVEKCVDSLINQTYKNLEIILVEDCSKDNTYNIIKDYPKKDKRIKVIKNKKNSGLSFTRNVGISKSTGEYIGFVDSDDYLNPFFYEGLMNAIISDKAEVAVCDITVVDELTDTQQIVPAFSNDVFNLRNVINSGLAASACNKLFKKELFKDNLFEVGKLNEDIAVVIPALVKAKNVAYAPDSYYYYVQRGGSIQNSSFSDKRFDIFSGVKATLNKIKDSKNYEDLKDDLVYNQLIAMFLFVIPKEKNRKRRKEILKKYDKLTREYNIRKNKNLEEFLKETGTKHRIYYKLLLKFTCTGHYFLANNLILGYDLIYKTLKKPVIPDNIDLKKVITAAKKQASLKNEKIKLSVVIPNYNYARFMYQRLYSILNQKYKIAEIIVLDDKSTDNSIEVIDEIINKINKYVNIKAVYNKTNSGSAFKQWQKGFELATGDYVWIAEADDYCSIKLLSKIMKPIKKDNAIQISYADTSFVDTNGKVMMYSIKKEIDIRKTGHWNKSYINNGLDEIKEYSYLNNTIANVSSCIIKKDDYHTSFEEAGKFKQAGDWLFYLYVMAKGKISYYDKPLNYYRVHGNNVSSTTKKQAHFDELIRIHDNIRKNFGLNKTQEKEIAKRYDFLKKAWGLEKK